MKIRVSWGNILKTLRERHDLMQSDVATLLHISRTEYTNIERGRVQPTAEMIAILSDIYDEELYRYAINSMSDELIAEQNSFKATMRSVPKEESDDLLRSKPGTYYGQENEDILKHLE